MKTILKTSLVGVMALCVAETAAFANVCTELRPGWSGEANGLVGEAFNLVFSPGGVVLLIMVALAMRLRNLWFSVVISACAALLAAINVYTRFNPVGIDVEGRREGCIGEPGLAIAIFVLLAVATLCWQFFGPKRKSLP
ncbi:MAG: hypothetical protein H2045_01210 [Rhizobiales bacterium]|nr:hypothetical protein [Hyphomicrobiales bacterium]